MTICGHVAFQEKKYISSSPIRSFNSQINFKITQNNTTRGLWVTLLTSSLIKKKKKILVMEPLYSGKGRGAL
jgi:hypothetical protein